MADWSYIVPCEKCGKGNPRDIPNCLSCGQELTFEWVPDPDAPEEHYDQGVTRLDDGEYDKAIGDFTHAISLDPDYAEAYYHRGLAYERKCDTVKAQADFAKAKELGYESK